MDDYSLVDVARITGGKRRSIQLWAEAQAIRAYSATDRHGTGTHRRFSREEVIIACCLNGLARRQVGIGELIRIGKGIRTFLNRGKARARIEEIIEAKEASWDEYLVIIWTEHRDPYVSMLEESDSAEFGNRVIGAGLSIILPLRKCLSGLKDWFFWQLSAKYVFGHDEEVHY
jgi:hypothetical protein